MGRRLTYTGSEIEDSDNESEAEYSEPDSAQLQMDTRAQSLLGSSVVAQTRPMEGYNPAPPQRLRRGRDVQTVDGSEPVDIEQVSLGGYI